MPSGVRPHATSPMSGRGLQRGLTSIESGHCVILGKFLNLSLLVSSSASKDRHKQCGGHHTILSSPGAGLPQGIGMTGEDPPTCPGDNPNSELPVDAGNASFCADRCGKSYLTLSSRCGSNTGRHKGTGWRVSGGSTAHLAVTGHLGPPGHPHPGMDLP